MENENIALCCVLASLEHKLQSLINDQRYDENYQSSNYTASRFELINNGFSDYYESPPYTPFEWPCRRNSKRERKRLRKLLQPDINTPGSFELIQKNMSQLYTQNENTQKAVKRRSSESAYSPTQVKIFKPDVQSMVKPIKEKISHGPSRVGICNVSSMNKDQMDLVHHALTQEILKIDAKGAGPRFLGFDHNTGWIVITCVDDSSRQWLATTTPKLRPWSGAKLTIMDASELPKPATGSTLIPESEAGTVEDALEMIRVQNPQLNPELWKVQTMKKEKSGLSVIFTLDEPSVQAIQKNKNKVSLGFQSIEFQIKNGCKAK